MPSPEASTARPTLQGWQATLVDTACVASGSVMVVAPLVAWAVAGIPPRGLAVSLVIGPVVFLLPRVPALSQTARSLALVGGDVLALATYGYHLGWTPAVVVTSCTLTTLTAVLLGRRVAFTLLGAQTVAVLLRGQFASEATYGAAMRLLDPSSFSNWLRVALVFALTASVLAVVLRQAASIVGTAHATAGSDLALAAMRLDAARAARQSRVLGERELREPQRIQAIGQLSAGLARLLLGALHRVDEALGALRRDPRDRERLARTILDAAQRVAGTLRELMVFGRRAEEGNPSRVALDEQVREVVKGLRPTLREEVTVTVQGVPGQQVLVHPGRLRQLVVNLVLNAQDALPETGEIRLTVLGPPGGDVPGRVQLVVEDSGAGMGPEVAARATDAFFTTRDPGRHPGLGLTVAAGIAEQAGGTLELESSPGAGTRVRVHLPLDGPSAPSAGEPPRLLHPAWLAPAWAPPRGEGAPAQLPSERPDAWKGEMIVRLGRATALTFAAILVVIVATAFDPSLDSAVLMSTLASGVAGFTPGLSPRVRGVLLVGTMAVVALFVIARVSFLSPGAVVGLVLAVGWTALLGPTRATPAMLAAATLALMGLGALHGSGVLTVDNYPRLTMIDPANWRRVAVVVGLAELVLTLSVLAIIDHARRAIGSMESAGQRLLAATADEEREAARLLTVERAAARSGRIEATGRAAGIIAHDLGGALQGLVGAAHELADPGVAPEEARAAVDELEAALDYARALGQQLDPGDESATAPAAPSDLSTIARRCTRVLPSLMRGGVSLECVVADGCRARVSEGDFRRVLFNLATNARDAAWPRGSVRVTVRGSEGRVLLEVADDGRGMDEATRARLFQAFFTTKPEGRGTGLGLYSVARILERTGGEVRVESAPRQGSTFRVAWPAAAPG